MPLDSLFVLFMLKLICLFSFSLFDFTSLATSFNLVLSIKSFAKSFIFAFRYVLFETLPTSVILFSISVTLTFILVFMAITNSIIHFVLDVCNFCIERHICN